MMKRVDCIVERSTLYPGLVTLRPLEVKPNEGGMGGTLRKRLTEAGYEPGDFVSISITPGHSIRKSGEHNARRKAAKS